MQSLISITNASTAIYIIEDMCYDIKGGVGKGEYADDLVAKLFESDFIIGNYKAGKWLEDGPGVFNAIGVIRDYEENVYGEVYTDFSNPEAVCNSYVRIVAETILMESECYRTLRIDGQCLDSDALNAIFDDLVMIARELN